jgi:hypothetical protein
MPKGSTKHKLAFKGATIMTNLNRYTAADLPTLMEKITRNSIGMDEYFDRLFHLHETTSNYPPYNLVQVSNVESRLELALAGFKKKEVYVYTQSMENFSLRDKKKIKNLTPTTSIRDWLNDLSREHGHYGRRYRSRRCLYLKMDSSL